MRKPDRDLQPHVQAYVERVVKNAPPLTPEQVEELRRLLRTAKA